MPGQETCSQAERRRGLALILVVGTLALLAVMGSAFVMLSRLERRAASQRVHGTRAMLLARSGIEDAMARVSNGQDPFLPASRYGGEDWDASGGNLSAFESQNEVFQGGTPNLENCPVRHAMRPSFFKRMGTGDPVTVPVRGKMRGFSGALSSGHWALKVEDEPAKINVNGGFLDALNRDGPAGGGTDTIPDHRDFRVWKNPNHRYFSKGWNMNLFRILSILGQQPEVALPTLATDVLSNRPVGGYRSIEDLQRRIGTKKDLTPYLTTSSPVVSPEETRTGAVDTEDGLRPPVNLNRASRPVLVALVQDIRWGLNLGAARAISAGDASAIVDAMLLARPFKDWASFHTFCINRVDSMGLQSHAVSLLDLPNSTWFHVGKTECPPPGGSGPAYLGALLEANFNPSLVRSPPGAVGQTIFYGPNWSSPPHSGTCPLRWNAGYPAWAAQPVPKAGPGPRPAWRPSSPF